MKQPSFSVQTTPVGFAPCVWQESSPEAAEALAKELSKTADTQRYPNPFWVINEHDRANAISKFYQGERLNPTDPI